GLDGAFGFRVHDDVMSLAASGDVDFARDAFEFCAELLVGRGSEEDLAVCRTVGKDGFDSFNPSNPTYVRLFGQDWLQFANAGLHMAFSATSVEVDMNASLKIDERVVNLREFGLTLLPEFELPTRFVLDVEVGELPAEPGIAFNADGLEGVIAGLAGQSGLNFELPNVMPSLGIGPVAGDDSVRLLVDLAMGRFPRVSTAASFYVSFLSSPYTKLGDVEIDIDATHAHLYGDVEIGGRTVAEARFDLDRTGLSMSAEVDVPVSGTLIRMAEGSACAADYVARGGQCVDHMVDAVATSAFECGYDAVASGVCHVRWFRGGRLCTAPKSCSFGGLDECRADFDQAKQDCDDIATIANADVIAKADLQLADTGFVGNAEADVCVEGNSSECYFVRSELVISDTAFSFDLVDIGAVQTVNSAVAQYDVNEVVLGYPFSWDLFDDGETHRTTLIDFDGDRRSDLVAALDSCDTLADTTPDTEGSCDYAGATYEAGVNELVVSLSGRGEPDDWLSAEELNSELYYGDLDGDGRSEVIAEVFESDSFALLSYSFANDDGWQNVTPAGISSVSGTELQIRYDSSTTPGASQSDEPFELRRVLVGDFDGDSKAEFLLVGETFAVTTLSAWLLCEADRSYCDLVYSGVPGIPYETLQVGYFNDDSVLDVFEPRYSGGVGQWVSYERSSGDFIPRSIRAQGYDDLSPEYLEVLQNDPLLQPNVDRALLFGDFNGDRRTDVFSARGRDADGRWIWRVSFAADNEDQHGDWVEVDRSWVTPDNLYLTDANGDGMADVLLQQDQDGDAKHSWRVAYGGADCTRRGLSALNTIEIDNTIPPEFLDSGAVYYADDPVTVDVANCPESLPVCSGGFEWSHNPQSLGALVSVTGSIVEEISEPAAPICPGVPNPTLMKATLSLDFLGGDSDSVTEDEASLLSIAIEDWYNDALGCGCYYSMVLSECNIRGDGPNYCGIQTTEFGAALRCFADCDLHCAGCTTSSDLFPPSQ
ncbi:MAG: hypothetical protein AAFU77_15335, partial [Myxococcota bacterium]